MQSTGGPRSSPSSRSQVAKAPSQAYDADILVIGCGPAGQAAAFEAAKSGKKVIVIDERGTVGGGSLHGGTIPSKTLREAARRLLVQRGDSSEIKPEDMLQLWWSVEEVIAAEIGIIRSSFEKNGIAFIGGKASLLPDHRVKVNRPVSVANEVACAEENILSAKAIILATGSVPHKPSHIQFDGKIVLSGDEVSSMQTLPRHLAIIGGGIIGSEYGSIFAALGVKVTIVERGDRLLASLDADLSTEFEKIMRSRGVDILHRSEVTHCEAEGSEAVIGLATGSSLRVDRVIVCAGRTPATKDLNLEPLGIKLNARGSIVRAQQNAFVTDLSGVYAAGDVLGGFGLASTATVEGNAAAAHAANAHVRSMSHPLPKGIYAMPELAAVGATEEELKLKNVSYVTAKSLYSETAKGAIRNETFGFLKLLVAAEDQRILGVHIIGEDAAELIHTGQLLIANNTTVQQLVSYAFNQPTFAELYRHAGYRCFNQLRTRLPS